MTQSDFELKKKLKCAEYLTSASDSKNVQKNARESVHLCTIPVRTVTLRLSIQRMIKNKIYSV